MVSRAKNLGLVSVILGASIVSGCAGLNNNSLLGISLSALGVRKGNPVAQVIGGQLSQYGSAQAGASNTNVYVNGNGSGNSNAPRWDIFTCTAYNDFNNDGTRDPDKEVIGKNKTEFFVGDTVRYVAVIYNCKGRTLSIFGQDKPGVAPRKFSEIIVDSDAKIYNSSNLKLDIPASWYAYWTLDGVKIGEHRINVREDPASQFVQK
ncbi:MAG: hypothetical protein AABW71_00850 [Nanoarchaeota archaeon]